jgi:CHASE2 domain-containing sensor protein/tRNA A-37 threonylcarbamoyl transferase component Bud32
MFSQNTAPRQRSNLAAPGALLLILVTLMVLAGDRMSAIESTFYDFLQKQHTAIASERIILVDTSSGDDNSLFWDMNRFEPVIEALNSAGAALIVPLEEPPANAQLPDLDQLATLAELEKRTHTSSGDGKQQFLTNQLNSFREQHRQREAIAAAVRDAGNIVLPIVARPTRQALEDAKDECRRLAISPTDDGMSGKTPWVREAAGTLMLPEIYCNSATNAGYANYWPDADGVVRHNHLLVKSGQRVFPSLALAVAQADRNNANLQLGGAYSLQFDEHNIKTGPGFTNLIRYYSRDDGQQAFRSVSVQDVASIEDAKSLFENNIVLVGDLTGAATSQFKTPFGDMIPMPILVATSLSNLLQMDFVSRPYWLSSAELVVLLVIGIVILLSAPNMSVNRAITVMLILAAMLLAIEAFVLMTYGIWLQLVTATLFSVLGIISIQALTPRLRVTAQSDTPAATTEEAESNLHPEDELDLKFSVLRQQPPTEETKKSLYDVAMKHGKQREFAKAERVLSYIDSIDTEYRDVRKKLKKLSGARERKSSESSKSSKSSETGNKTGQDISNESSPTTSGNKTLGRYIIEEVLGRGAMATVYLGRDPKINRKVAIKSIALAEEFSDDDLEAAKSQFIREAESAGRLNHPNIITIYDTGEDGNVAYLAMEYFHGKALNCFTQSDTLLPPKWVFELTARAAEALHYAHGQGVVHRDIKPANLMYDAASDQFKITDFGIARLTDTSRTKTGIILGTPSYMSPEQLSASAVTGSSDLYSLGITMYQLLTGTTPFRSDSIPKLMDKIMNGQHTPVSSIRNDLPPDIDAVLDKMLAKKPEDRYQNGRAMALALRDCCSTLSA